MEDCITIYDDDDVQLIKQVVNLEPIVIDLTDSDEAPDEPQTAEEPPIHQDPSPSNDNHQQEQEQQQQSQQKQSQQQQSQQQQSQQQQSQQQQSPQRSQNSQYYEEEMLKQQHEQELLRQQHEQELLRRQHEQELLRQQHEQDLLRQQREQELLRQQREQDLLRQQREQELLRQQREQEILRQQREQELIKQQQSQQYHQQQQQNDQQSQTPNNGSTSNVTTQAEGSPICQHVQQPKKPQMSDQELMMAQKALGNEKYKHNLFDDAIRTYKRANELARKLGNKEMSAILHFNLAMTYYKLGSFEQAADECANAVKLDDKYMKAHLKRAEIYQRQCKFEEAVICYEHICELDSTNQDYAVLLNYAKEAAKKTKKRDCFQILGLNSNFTQEDLKKAYRHKALSHHPDRHSDADIVTRRIEEKLFKDASEAHTFIQVRYGHRR